MTQHGHRNTEKGVTREGCDHSVKGTRISISTCAHALLTYISTVQRAWERWCCWYWQPRQAFLY